jgi:nucleotide-binding universal stress UspA family protein
MIVIQTILAAIDFTECSEAALREARRLADAFNACLHVLYVVDEPFHEPWTHYVPGAELVSMLRQHEMRARARLEELVSNDLTHGRVVIATVWGNPSDEIIKYAADHRVDLIVCGTHGRRGWDRMLLGSVAERVVRLSASPVLTVREPAAAA